MRLERVSDETLRYFRVALGLMEPEERSCSNFSWSNSTTSDLTVDPSSLSSLRYGLLIGKENIPQRSSHHLFNENLDV